MSYVHAKVPPFREMTSLFHPLSTLESRQNGDKTLSHQHSNGNQRKSVHAHGSFESVLGSLALHLAERPLDNVEISARPESDRGQCRRGSLLLSCGWLRTWGRWDGLVSHRKVTSWTTIAPLLFVFTVLPKGWIE